MSGQPRLLLRLTSLTRASSYDALALLQHLLDHGVVLTPYPDGTLRYKAPKAR